ncbi:hypothetical protein AB8Z38_00315 [Bradyrhizobium sp. LLZ17]|uniref:Uncharacterized protein n=1 Tax=Bradyrhizobium sp. LLZ17 TaxID=3239388 RepID=A0AB39XLS7_9BRAD
MGLLTLKRKLREKMALRAAVRRRRVELEGWNHMLRACHNWADEIGHEPSREALLGIAENYRKALENAESLELEK